MKYCWRNMKLLRNEVSFGHEAASQFIGPYNTKKKHIQMDVLLFGAASQI